MTFGSGGHPGAFAGTAPASQALASARDSAIGGLPRIASIGPVSPPSAGKLLASGAVLAVVGGTSLLTVREVATRLGVCTASVYRLCARGELAHHRIGSAIRVAPADLARLLAGPRGR